MIKFENRQRYVIEHWNLHYYKGDWVRTPYTVIEEFICRDGKLSAWTGSYSCFSTHSVHPDNIVRVIGIKENS